MSNVPNQIVNLQKIQDEADKHEAFVAEQYQEAIISNEGLDAGLTVEGQLERRFKELFMRVYSTHIYPEIHRAVNTEVADAAMRLGRQLGTINNVPKK